MSSLDHDEVGARAEDRGAVDNKGLSILLLVRSLESGGAERQLVALALGLHQRGHRVSVAAFYAIGPLGIELEKAQVPILDLRKRGRWDILRFLNRLRRLILKTRPDVMYSFLGGANIVAALVQPFVPRTKLVWSVRSSYMDLSRYDWTHRLAYKIERALSGRPDLIIANSYSGREVAVANGFPLRRIEVVANGIDTDCFRPDLALRSRQRAAWGLTEEEIAVGVLARLDPMKGHVDFLAAASRIARENPNVRFFCIGSGPEEETLKALALRLEISDVVRFPGATTEAASALNGLDIYCSPSDGEGFSNAIAEAMACGLPCVVTDVGDSARIVGDFGSVVPPGDPEALADAILRLVIGNRKRTGAQARRRVVKEFSAGAMVDRTLELLA